MPEPPVVLTDTMIVIEAIRTGCWNAITGQRKLVTVEKCREELLRGDSALADYVPVTEQDIARLGVEPVDPVLAVRFRLECPGSDALDPGERDLLAYAFGLKDDFLLCSSDKAAVRIAHRMGLLESVVSLQVLVESVGGRARPALKLQFTERWMSAWRTALLFEGSA